MGFLQSYIARHHTQTSIDRPVPQPNSDSGYYDALEQPEYGSTGRGGLRLSTGNRGANVSLLPPYSHLSVNLLEEENLVRRVEGRKARACNEDPQDDLSYDGQYFTSKAPGTINACELTCG